MPPPPNHAGQERAMEQHNSRPIHTQVTPMGVNQQTWVGNVAGQHSEHMQDVDQNHNEYYGASYVTGQYQEPQPPNAANSGPQGNQSTHIDQRINAGGMQGDHGYQQACASGMQGDHGYQEAGAGGMQGGGYQQAGSGGMQGGGYQQAGSGGMQGGGYQQAGSGGMQGGGYQQAGASGMQGDGYQQAGGDRKWNGQQEWLSNQASYPNHSSTFGSTDETCATYSYPLTTQIGTYVNKTIGT